jgi:predicted glycosyltransferase
MFSDEQLGQLRAKELANVVELYNPRLVLVDHTPQGKHKELVPALSAGGDTRWILGVRGVVGAVKQARSALAAQLFKDHYQAILWYGDSSVLGASHFRQLQEQYDTQPVECGYVLRLAEFAFWNSSLMESDEHPAGTISVPWLGGKSINFLKILSAVLEVIPGHFGPWRLFVDTESSGGRGRQIRQLFENIPGCRIESPGSKYFPALLHSKTAIIYGGYNSLMDVIHAGIPALVILREMEDEEQQLHLQKLKKVTGDSLLTLSEAEVSAEELQRSLLKHLQRDRLDAVALRKNGAACAAEFLHSLL